MHIHSEGRGPDIVLIHGWALSGEVFAPLLERLRAHCTVHVVDLPAHGRSRDDITPLRLPFVVSAIAAATPPAVWCGWSLGGLFALHAAATLPQVRGLAMMASTPRFVRADDWPHAAQPALLTTLRDDLAADYAGTVERFIALDLIGQERDPDLRALRTRLLQAPPPPLRALDEGLQLLQKADLRAALRNLPVPSLWMAGHRDRLVSPQAMRAASELAPAAQMQVIAHAGHAPFLGQADIVAGLLQRFVADPAATDGGQ